MDAGLNGYIPNGEDRDTASPSLSLGNLCAVKTTKYDADRVIYSRRKRARKKEDDGLQRHPRKKVLPMKDNNKVRITLRDRFTAKLGNVPDSVKATIDETRTTSYSV